MKLYTQKQAAKKFPDREYEKYDKMFLIAGTKKEFECIPIEHAIDCIKFDSRISVDVCRKNDYRVVVWDHSE